MERIDDIDWSASVMKSDTETELVLDSHIADSELVEDEEYLLVLVLDEVDVSAKSIAQ